MKNRAAVLGWFAVLGLGVTFYSIQITKDTPSPSAASAERAFLNATWGMSKDEVIRSNRLPLEKAVSSLRFYKTLPGADDSRYQTWRSEGQRFLGRPAMIHYTFLDDRLFAFHVFISDPDPDALDSDMRRYLLSRFGPFSEPEEDPALKSIWQTKDFTVNYWFYERETSLIGRHRAGYGVLYHPIERLAFIDSQ